MALPLLVEQRVTAAKVEGTYGTAESLTATEAAMIWFDSKMQPMGAITERKGQSALSRIKGVPGVSWNEFTGKSEIYGGLSTPVPAWGDFLKASGMALATATYTPQTGGTAQTSLTTGVYSDGTAQLSSGMMFDFTMQGETGKPVMIDWHGWGKYLAPTDTAILVPTYPDPSASMPIFQASTLTIGGTAYNISKFELSPNNQVQLRKAGNQTAAAPFGCLGAYITDRKWTFKATVEASLLATKDWFGLYQAGTTGALASTFGATTNNICSIAAPCLQMNKPPTQGELDGMKTHELEFDCVRSSSAGDDEVSIVFT